MTDLNAAEFYANPENRHPVGAPRRRKSRGRLSNHVAIRFAPATIAFIRALAAREAVSVSSWVRAVVEREVDRRLPIPRTGASSTPTESIKGPRPDVETANPSYANKEPDLKAV